MRTQDEIEARVAALKGDDFFGFETSDLLGALTFERVKKHLREDAAVDAAKWEAERLKTDEDVRKQIVEYLPFAWEKAVGHRGLSAGRSIAHFRAWCWLLGDDEAVDTLDSEDRYVPYGAPLLAFLSDRFGVEKPTETAAVRMAAGESCGATYACGCQQ